MMTILLSGKRLLAACALLLVLVPVLAGEGHDHGEQSPASSGPSLPRMTAVSEAFELVGVLNGKQILLYLDRASDNSPVSDAKLDIEVNGVKQKVEKQADGEFEVVLAQAPKAGALALSATVSAGSDSDLLAGEFDIHGEAEKKADAHAGSFKQKALWLASGLIALALLFALVRHMVVVRHHRKAGRL